MDPQNITLLDSDGDGLSDFREMMLGSKKGKVTLGGLSLKILSWKNDLIIGRLDKPLNPGVYDIIVKPKEPKGASPINYKNTFTVKEANILSIEPSEGTAWDEIIINGEFFGSKKGKVYLEYEEGNFMKTINCKVLKWWMNPITGESEVIFKVPKMLPAMCYVVLDPYGAIPEVEEEDAFTGKAPEIMGVDPNSGSIGEPITIVGNYFGVKKGKVYLGYISQGKFIKKDCPISSWSDEEIVFVVPKLSSGSYDLIVPNSVGSHTWGQKFIVK